MALQLEGLADLLEVTHNNIIKKKRTALIYGDRKYLAVPKVFKENKISVGSGPRIEYKVQKFNTGAAANVGEFEPNNYQFADTMTTGTVPWRNARVTYTYTLKEMQVNAGSTEQQIALIEARDDENMASFVELEEENLWGTPTSSSDNLSILGVQAWIQRGGATAGFTGGNPSWLTTGLGGIDVADVPRYKNYSARFDNVTEADLLAKLRKCFEFIQFRSPRPISGGQIVNEELTYEIFSTWTGRERLVELQEARNDQLGGDLAGNVTFHQIPVTVSPEVEKGKSVSTQDHPYLFINWDALRPYFLDSWDMRRTVEKGLPGRPNDIAVSIESTRNIVAVDRRRLGIVYESV